MQLSLVCFAIIVSSSSAIVLDCNFKLVFSGNLGNIYTCNPSVVNSGSLRLIEELKGKHHDGKSNCDVLGFYVLKQTLNHIPRNLASYFPKLRTIWIYESNLKTISAQELKSFPELIELGLYSNKLKILDGDLFRFTKKINWIHLFNNSLEQVGSDLLTDMTVLGYINLDQNTCVNRTASSILEVQALNKELPIMCRCSLRCSLGEDVDELKSNMQAFIDSNEQQARQIDELIKVNARYEKRLNDFEKLVRDMNANPGR